MRFSTERRARAAGFTLIELLLVVAIIALLATMAAPRVNTAISNARRAQGEADMLTIPAALERYFTDHYTYPAGADAAELTTALRSGYLPSTIRFRNGYRQGYLYLTSYDQQRYLLIDLQGEAQDDDPAPGQQIIVLCANPGDPDDFEERIYNVSTGETAGLTLPTVDEGYDWVVLDWLIEHCALKNPNPQIRLVTQPAS